MRRLAKKIAENPEIKKGVEKDVDENLNALGRSLQTIDTSTIGALVGGALLGIGYLNSQEEGKNLENFKASQDQLAGRIEIDEKSEKPANAALKRAHYNHNQVLYKMQEHDFIKRSLFPSDREGIEREERNYQELLVGLREEPR